MQNIFFYKKIQVFSSFLLLKNLKNEKNVVLIIKIL